MSDFATAAVWNNPRVKGSTKLLLLAIANVADHNGVAWCSVTFLSGRTGLSRQGVYENLERLEAADELVIEPNHEHIIPPKARLAPRNFLRILCVGADHQPRRKSVRSSDKHCNSRVSEVLTGMSEVLTTSVRTFDVHTKDRSTYGSTTEDLRVSDADAPETENPGDDGTPDAGGEPPAPPLTPDDLHADWNDGPARAGCAVSTVLTPTLRRNLERLIREHPDRLWWDTMYARVIASPYLTGELNGNRARLGWLVDPRNDTLVKLEEGQYDARARKERGATPQPSRDGRGGNRCPHETQCESMTECRDRIVAESRAKRAAAYVDDFAGPGIMAH